VQLDNQTLRQIVHTSIGGQRVRVVLSNRYGTGPLTIGAAYVALRDKEAAIMPASGRTLSFSGKLSAVIPAGAVLVSDAAELSVPALSDLAIDIYLPADTTASKSPLTMHAAALQTNYVSQPGNHAGEPILPVATSTQSWFLLGRVEVAAPDAAGAVVAFGDSITDGTRSTPDTNNRWPDQFARRLLAGNSSARLAVLNAAIAGNRVLSEANPPFGINALARFDHDVLAQAGVTHVIVMEGINDIGMARQGEMPSPEEIIAGHRQLIERAHTRGLTIFGATLTAFEGAAYWSEAGERTRQAVNEWIRTGGAYDGLIDFDQVLRDPAHTTQLQAQYDSGDHLHPNDAGYLAMANAVDLKALSKPRR
jgi:lysophospholipase L1-like esterase